MAEYFNLKNKGLIVIILLFIILCSIKIFLSLQFQTPYFMWDEAKYDDVAKNILNGNLYTLHSYWVTYPPGYPIFLSISYLFSQNKEIVYHIMLAINVLLITSIIFPSYFILKRYCSESISLLGASVVATLPIINIFPFALLSENLFIPLFVYSAWLLLKSFETDNKFYEILASISIGILYITRSLGIAMIMGFLVLIIFYVHINRKELGIVGALNKKKILLSGFIITLASWLIYTTFFITGRNYSFGNPYNAESASLNILFEAFLNPSMTVKFFQVFVADSTYLILSSYFLILIFLIYYLFSTKNRVNYRSPYNLTLFFIIVSSVSLFAINIIVHVPVFDKLGYTVYGRYIEPIMPLLFITIIIWMSQQKIKTIDIKKALLILASYIILSIIIILNVYIKNYELLKTVSLYYLYCIYDLPVIQIILGLVAMLMLFLVYSSIENKKFIYCVLFMCLILSIVSTIPTYSADKLISDLNNDGIVNYIRTYSNENTVILTNRSDFLTSGVENGKAAFWCNGDFNVTENLTMSINMYKGKQIYILSQHNSPYPEVANDSFFFKLYKVE